MNVAGQADFTPDEWATLQRAMMASGVLVSLAEGVVDADEIFALMQKLNGARAGHPNQLIRELADLPSFSTGLRGGTRYSDYRGPGLEAIRSATAMVARKAPAEHPAFCAFLLEVAEAVADANREGGFLGVGGQRRTPNEAAAIEAIRTAMGLAR